MLDIKWWAHTDLNRKPKDYESSALTIELYAQNRIGKEKNIKRLPFRVYLYMRKYRNYTDEDVIRFAKEVKSIAGLLKKLDLKPVGGNYANIKRIIQRLQIDCSHWTGQGWNKGQQLKDWSNYTQGASAKPHLIKLRGHKCESCNLSEWLGDLIPLEIHHVDGDKTNNGADNLQLLCPNCHSCTKDFRKPLWLNHQV